MLRGAGIELVRGQALLAGLKRESVPWDLQSKITRLRTDTAIALRNGDDCRRQHVEPDPSAMTPTLMFNHRLS